MASNDNKIQMPGAFGGLMRYDDEYSSSFMLSPTTVIAFIVAVIAFVLILKIFFPFDSGVSASGFTGGGHGFILSLLSNTL